MITACKSYITSNGTQTVWTQPQSVTIKKLRDSIKLNQEYQSCFQKTKLKLAQMPDERPFDFSEMYIFGKFETFTRRCKNVIDLFTTMTTYNRLSEVTIEGSCCFCLLIFFIFFSMFFNIETPWTTQNFNNYFLKVIRSYSLDTSRFICEKDKFIFWII